MALRRELHALGLRYRVDHPVLPGVRRRPDVVFTAARVAVFVDGCFWHRCPQHATQPKNNATWWVEKLQRTVDRDRDTDQRLAAAGWTVVRVWEHERPDQAAAQIRNVVLPRRPGWPGAAQDGSSAARPTLKGVKKASRRRTRATG